VLLLTLLLLQLFFAKVPRSASAEQIKSLFARFGDVTQLDLFAEYPVSVSTLCLRCCLGSWETVLCCDWCAATAHEVLCCAQCVLHAVSSCACCAMAKLQPLS
jgi:hypothetical protein